MYEVEKSESQRQSELLVFGKNNCIYIEKISCHAKNGHPDLICHYAGRTIYIEMKKGKNSQCTVVQKKYHGRLKSYGIPTYIIFDVDDGIKLLKSFKNGGV